MPRYIYGLKTESGSNLYKGYKFDNLGMAVSMAKEYAIHNKKIVVIERNFREYMVVGLNGTEYRIGKK